MAEKNYIPLVPMVATQPSEISLGKDATVAGDGSIVLTRSPMHEALIKKTSCYVYLLIFIQLMSITISLFCGNLLGFFITMIFIVLGLQGLKRQHRPMLIAHFTYSLFTLFGMIAGFVILVFYCRECFVVSIMLGIAILIKTLLLRQERILLSALSKTDLPICIVKAKPTENEKVAEKQDLPQEKQVSVVPVELQQQVEQQSAPMSVPYYLPMSQFDEQGQIQGQPQMFYYPMMDSYGQTQWMPVAQPYFYPGFEAPQQQQNETPAKCENEVIN